VIRRPRSLGHVVICPLDQEARSCAGLAAGPRRHQAGTGRPRWTSAAFYAVLALRSPWCG